MMPPLSFSVRLHDVCVRFHGRDAVRNVSLDFPDTGLFVLVGRSGSGKTTLLRTLNRLNEAFPGCETSGRIELNLGRGLETILPEYVPECTVACRMGRSLSDLRRRVGMVFQTPNVFPVSIFKNMSLPLEHVADVPQHDIPDRIHAALEAVGLWNEVHTRLDAPAESLSGGQQQRLCLARMLALEPSILLLDEPTASLDIHATREVEALLIRLAEKYPVIMVSHSLSQALRLAQQLLIFRDGRLVRHFHELAGLAEGSIASLMELDAD